MPKLAGTLAIIGCWLTFLPRVAIPANSTHTGPPVPSHYERPTTKGGPYKKRVIVFVHGLFGDADGSWRYSPSVYWPKLLLTDEAFRDSDVYVASYPSPYFGNMMNLDEVVTNLNNRLVSDEVFSKHQEVVFVCHSMGGLVVQRLLLTYRDYSQQVPFIYFFSTPETGAQLADLAKVFDSDPLLKTMIPGDENVYLQNLENEWKASQFHIHRFCAYEKKKTYGALVVDRLSGTRNCDDPPVAINEDHLGIAKPNGKEHDSYIALRNAIRSYPISRRATVPTQGTATARPAERPPIQRTAKFAVMVPFDTAPNSAPIPRDENPDDPLDHTYMEMEDLIQRGTIPDSVRESKETGQITWTMNPVTMRDPTVFFGRLLQYCIFSSVDNLQHNSLTTFVGYPAKAHAGIEPPDGELYSDENLSTMLADNRFFRPFLFRPNYAGISRMRLPKGTIVRFREESKNGDPPDHFVVQYTRPKYFKLEFDIEPFVGTGTGSVPKNFVTSRLSTTMQWTFFVTMRYSVEHPEDATFAPDNYVKWMDELYDGISGKFVIPGS